MQREEEEDEEEEKSEDFAFSSQNLCMIYCSARLSFLCIILHLRDVGTLLPGLLSSPSKDARCCCGLAELYQLCANKFCKIASLFMRNIMAHKVRRINETVFGIKWAGSPFCLSSLFFLLFPSIFFFWVGPKEEYLPTKHFCTRLWCRKTSYLVCTRKKA